MKYSIIGLFVLLVLTVSCSQDDYLRYDTDTASLRFVYSSYGNDSTVFSFGLHPDVEEAVVEVPVQLIGLASSEAREVGVEVLTDQTTAVENRDYVIERSELDADSITGSLKVRVIKNSELDNGNKVVTVRLCSNSYFSAAPINYATFRIVVTNELAEPVGWPFDDYSRVKHEFVILHTGVANYYNKWSTSELVYWKGVLINALYEYNKAHPGEPLTDENGLIVTF
jgi:hypothetical protein